MRKYQRTLGAYLLRISLLLLCAELTLRVYALVGGPKWELDQRFIILPEYKSAYIYRRAPDRDQDINNYSMRRADDISETPAPGIKRILSYGDSIGWGFNVETDEAYPSLLEAKLNQDQRGYEVLNMARGYCPSIYSFHIKRDIFQFRPQMVLMEIELLNDLGDEEIFRSRGRDEHGLPKDVVRARYWPGWQSMPPIVDPDNPLETLHLRRGVMYLKRATGYLATILLPNRLFDAPRKSYYYNLGYDRWLITRARIDRAFEEMFVTIKNTQVFCQDHGIDFLLLVLPSKNMFFEGDTQESSIRIYEKAEAECQRLGISYLSLAALFRENGGEALFMDVCHPTPAGYELIVQSLHGHLTSDMQKGGER